MNFDTFKSVEFDLTEAIKDFIYNIKVLQEDVDSLKEQVKNLQSSK